jgi:hypothetical protein
MATWNGSWLSQDPDWTALVSQNLDFDTFAKFALRIPALMTLITDLEAFIKRRITKLGFDK